jgi:3-deoxy-D-manno-octulosonic-acid transferase
MTVSRPLSLRLYALAARGASLLAPAFLARRAREGKEDPTRLGERFGRTDISRPAGPLVWLHGASVGEGLSLLPLVGRLRETRPDAPILVTTGTRTSAEVLAERLPRGAIHQFVPVDTPSAVTGFLDHWRPSLVVFVESELWPNLILAAKASGARMALISARMSEASARTWRLAPSAAKAVLGAFDLILARDDAASMRLSALGARVDGLADMKFGAHPLPADESRTLALRAALGRRRVILASSTHPGEERLILRAYAALGDVRARALLVIVPRHPERGPEVKALARALGLHASRQGEGETPGAMAAHVADGLGELGLWYRLADLVVLGGGLAPGIGGHNPLEPARLGAPFISGPFVENWPVYGALRACGGTGTVATVDDLERWFRGAVAHPGGLSPMAEAARAWVAERDAESAAALGRVVALLPA